MATVLYSILHMFVDGTCAIAMYGWFTSGSQGYLNILLYNFCAFALQMPLGTLLDLLLMKVTRQENVPQKGKMRYPFVYAAAGVLFTIIGAITHPAILGIGNALFHVGGGVDVIIEDKMHKWKGQALGIFVAPGAFGLYIGSLIAKEAVFVRNASLFIIVVLMIAVMILLYCKLKNAEVKECSVLQGLSSVHRDFKSAGMNRIMVCCLLVVILRSYVGMAVSFSWKTTVTMGLLCVSAVVLGKMAGGILAARFDMRKVMVCSLVLSAVCYMFCENAVLGIAAQFFFNMTMSITLYLLVCRFENLPGFSFGLLTFGLFIGFLPVYWEVYMPVSGNIIGAVGSLISLGILLIAVFHKSWKFSSKKHSMKGAKEVQGNDHLSA